MKVAGRKNDGAWYRANVVIKGLSSGERTALAASISSLDSAANYVGVIQDFYNAAGLSSDENYPADVSALGLNYTTNGIPRQAWMGVLSYDRYNREGTSGDYTYTPINQANAFAFGKDIRKLMKQFVFARRQAKDLTNVAARNTGNPGGIADASPGN